MKPHRILKTFPGSQHGNDYDVFHKDSVRDLSDGLAAIAVSEGWAEPADAESLVGAVPEADLVSAAELRETKVSGPDETKPAKKKAKK